MNYLLIFFKKRPYIIYSTILESMAMLHICINQMKGRIKLHLSSSSQMYDNESIRSLPDLGVYMYTPKSSFD